MKYPQRTLIFVVFSLFVLFTSCQEVEEFSPKATNKMEVASIQQNAFAVSYTLSNWMGSIEGITKLSKISIPGTHDSGALYEPIGGTAKCQTLTIGEQLNAGVRFLDIRCRHIDNAFTIHHGAVYQNMNFNDVLSACLAFLASNPTETIIMSVKEEHTPQNNNRSFEATLDTYLQQNPAKWFIGESVPTLAQVRGKIVLLRRFGATTTPKGINATAWADNATFEINTPQAQIKVQDLYKVSNNDAKWNALQSLISEAKGATTDKLYINYASGYRPLLFGIPSITSVSNDINPRITSFFNANQAGHFGIIPMDFATASRNELIIRTNFAQ